MFVPKLFTTLKGYTRKRFFADAGAGVIVALIAFPLSIALGVSSGVSPEVGLYTAVIGCVVVALLGGSRVQAAGPTGAFVVIVAGIIGEHGLSGLALATMMAGLLLVLLGLARMGGWSYFAHLRWAPKSDYLVFLATFSLTILFDLVVGILVGMVLAAFLFMKRMADVSSVELIAHNDQGREDRLFPAEPADGDQGFALYAIRGPFFFGAAEKFLRMLRRMGGDVSRVTLDLSGVPAMDATAFRALEMMADQMRSRKGRLLLTGLNDQPRRMLQRYGFFDRGEVEEVLHIGKG